MLRVNEIFHSIQGEAGHAGWPCVFVRLTGCNLRCTYCDTQYAYEEGRDMSVSEVVDHVLSMGCPLVQVTGGEPLMQDMTPHLVEDLLQSKCTVLMETNGSLDIDRVDRRVVRIVDMKSPSSGHHAANDYRNLQRLTDRDHLKLVIADRKDYDFARDIYRNSPELPAAVHFSPVHGVMNPHRLAEWILLDKLQVRLNLQLHKIIWGDDVRGV